MQRGRQVRQRGCIERSRMRTCAFFLTAAAIGSGVLALPYILKLCGAILGILLLMCGYFATYWSFQLIIEADHHTGGNTNFKSLYKACGGRCLASLYDISLIASVLGALVTGQIMIANLFQAFLSDIGCSDPERWRLLHIVLVSVVIIFPISNMRSVTACTIMPFISCLCMLYCAIILIIELPCYIANNNFFSKVEYFRINWDLFDAFGVTFFAYQCQPIYYYVIGPLRKRDIPHEKRVILRSNTYIFILYTIIAICGYFSTLELTPDLFLVRRPCWRNVTCMVIAQIAVVSSLCVNTLLNYIPLRGAIFNIIFREPVVTRTRAFLSSLIFTASTCGISILVRNSGTALAVAGGVGTVLVCYVCPVLAYYAAKPHKDCEVYLSLLLGFILSLVGLASALHPIFLHNF